MATWIELTQISSECGTYCFLQSEFYGSNLSLTDSVTPPVITPPPTPVNRFLAFIYMGFPGDKNNANG